MPRHITLWLAFVISLTSPAEGYSKLVKPPQLEPIPESESESDSDEEEGRCKPIDEKEGESRYCYVHSGETTGLGYSLEVTEDGRLQALNVLCPGKKIYTITTDGIEEIEHEGESYDVKIDDPLKDFNAIAFNESQCPIIFRKIQTEVLEKGEAVDEGPRSLCEEITDKFCSIYDEATKNFPLPT